MLVKLVLRFDEGPKWASFRILLSIVKDPKIENTSVEHPQTRKDARDETNMTWVIIGIIRNV